MNPQTVCNYAYIRFVPNPVTEEFANVGVVMIANRPLSLLFKLEQSWTGRLAGFFAGTAPEIYLSSRKILETELQRMAAMIGRATLGLEPEMTDFTEEKLIQLFRELVRPREGRLHFSTARTALAEDPKLLLQELFEEAVAEKNNSLSARDAHAMAV